MHVALLLGLLVLDNQRVLEIELFNIVRRQGVSVVLRASEAWLRPALALLMVLWLGPTIAAVLFGYLLAGAVIYVGFSAFRIERIGVAESINVQSPDSAEVQHLAARIRRFGIPLAPLALMEWISSLSDRYLIWGLLGLDSAGSYIAGYGPVALLFSLMYQTIELLIRPYYFEAVASGDRAQARSVLVRWIILLASSSTIVIIGITLLSETIVSLLLAERYRDAAHLLPYFAIGYASWSISLLVEKIFHAQQRTEWCLVVRAAGAVLSVAVAAPMIYFFGILGAAQAVPIYYGGQLVLCAVLASRFRESSG